MRASDEATGMPLEHLLRAVRDAPEAFGPLLAYADALAAAGDPLGEFVRVQCALARGGLAAEERVALHGREHALLAAHEEAWLGPLRGVVDHHVWWRGLLGVDVSVAGFLRAHADLVAARCVRFVDVSDWSAQLEPGAWRELTACADLRAVTLLGVRGRYLLDPDHALLQDNDVCMLAASPHVHRLVGLDLDFNAIGDAGLAAIARSPHLAGLRSLQLRGCRYGAAGLQVLANEASFVGLETLDLSYCEGLPASDPSAGAAGWRAVGNSSRLPALRQLSIAGNAIPDDIQVALARWTASSY